MVTGQRDIMANIERLHQCMDQADCAAIVVRSGKNVTYLAGFAYPGTLARHLDFPDSPREVLLVWPRQGEPVLITNYYAAPLARRDSWLSRIEVYDDYAESPYALTADLLRQLGLHQETIGFEKTYLSATRWEEINHLLPHITMRDCTEMMAQVRWIKTPGEMRVLLRSKDPRAAEAVDLFIYRVGRELGSLVAALGGLDALVFTAGIGQHSASIRARVCHAASWLGLRPGSPLKNSSPHTGISREAAP